MDATERLKEQAEARDLMQRHQHLNTQVQEKVRKLDKAAKSNFGLSPANMDWAKMQNLDQINSLLDELLELV